MKLSGVKKKRDDVASRRRCVWGPGQGPPEFWSLAFSYFYQKRWFSQFRMGKMNFHHFLFRYTPGKIYSPPGKNPCDTRGRSPSRGEEKCPMTTQLKELLTLGIHGWSTTLGVSFFCCFYIPRKYEKPVFPWLFLIFKDKWNGTRVILQKCPWKPTYTKLGYYTTQG